MSERLLHRLVVLVELAILLFSYRGASAGFSLEEVNDRVHVEAHSPPAALAMATTALLLYWFVFRRNRTIESLGAASLKRRALALLIDFYLSMVMIAAPTGFVMVLVEDVRTGHSTWGFERNYTTSTDWGIGIPLVLFSLFLLFLYFVYPLTRGSQTLGCYIMRTRVTPPFGEEGRFTFRQAVWRTLYELRGIPTLLDRGSRFPDGTTWWDRKTNSRVLLVNY